MFRQYIRRNITSVSIILFVVLFCIIQLVEPAFLYEKDGSLRQFVANETITGSTSNATATVLIDDSRNGYLYISSQQKFITDETITGGTSGSTATISEYRANQVQNIQQLLEYANTDNTIYDFLEQFRYSFMNAIPSTLASGVSKRNLIKNIKDLYTAKGTSEATKLFMKIF